MGSTKYAYSVARIRAMETRLLDKGRVEAMLESNSAQDALRILSETDYGSSVSNIENVHDYEQLLVAERKNVYEDLMKMAPDPRLFTLFAYRYDFHNMKVLLKAKYLGEDANHLLVDTGTIASAAIRKMVLEENYSDLEPFMRDAVMEAIAEFEKDEDPQVISFVLDRALYSTLKDLAKKYKSPFLAKYFQRQIDLLNIGAFLRVKNLGKSREYLENVLLPGGSLDTHLFLSLYAEPDAGDAIISRLSNSDYAQVVEEGVRAWNETKSTTFFEKLADDYLTEFSKQAKTVAFGPEPLIAYYLAKDTEIKIIRLIMVGKLNGISVEDIRERLRDVYA